MGQGIIKKNFTISRSLAVGPHNQIQLIIIRRLSFFWGGAILTRLLRMQLSYSNSHQQDERVSCRFYLFIFYFVNFYYLLKMVIYLQLFICFRTFQTMLKSTLDLLIGSTAGIRCAPSFRHLHPPVWRRLRSESVINKKKNTTDEKRNLSNTKWCNLDFEFQETGSNSSTIK